MRERKFWWFDKKSTCTCLQILLTLYHKLHNLTTCNVKLKQNKNYTTSMYLSMFWKKERQHHIANMSKTY